MKAAKIAFADDPSNRDPRFTRARLRGLMPELAREGLDARRLSLLARRLKRADMAIEAAVDRADADWRGRRPRRAPSPSTRRAMPACRPRSRCACSAARWRKVGDEGPVELGKLEALKAALDAAQNAGTARFRRTLAGALVTLDGAANRGGTGAAAPWQNLNQARTR